MGAAALRGVRASGAGLRRAGVLRQALEGQDAPTDREGGGGRGREPKVNLRFVVTNLRRHRPANLYALYCQRGDIENRVKEIKAGVALDRTSCTDFWANQLRVLLAAAAFAILQELRTRLRGTGLARAQVDRLRLCLLRIGARIERSVRRIVVHLAAAHPWQPPWTKAAVALGATRR
ncbi:MAG: transposase [Planctomycetota bacterium]